MGIKTNCDICGKFIAEHSFHERKIASINMVDLVVGSYTIKSMLEKGTRWPDNKEEIKLWACDHCADAFTKKIHSVLEDMGISAK